MSIDKILSYILEADPNETWVNPKTGNRVGRYRAMQLGLIKPNDKAPEPVAATKAPSKGHATGPRPKKDPNAPKPWWHHMTKYKLNAYPVNIPEDQVKVNLSGDINSHAVMQWKSPKTGETVSAYTQEFLKKNAELKWKRLMKIKPKDIQHIHDTANKILSSPKADDKLKQSAAIISIIAHTGLRIGSVTGFGKTGNRGVMTLSSDNISIQGDTIKFNFVGKSYQENEAEIHDMGLAQYLTAKKSEKQNSPFLFTVQKGYIDKVYDQYMKMEKFKIKDLRTYVANKVAKDLLYKDPASPPPLPKNPKEIKNVVKEKLKSVFVKVSEVLNNTPSMARTSYIHPKIIHDWLNDIGVKAVTVGYNEATLKEVNLRQVHALRSKYDKNYDGKFALTFKEDEFDDMIASQIDSEDEFDDVDFYPLPEWWDDENIQLVPIGVQESLKEGMVGNRQLKDGDIISIPSHGNYAIVSINNYGRSIMKFNVVHTSQVDKVLDEGKGISILSTRPGSTYDVIGKLDAKKVKSLQDIVNGIYQKKAEKTTQNYSKIEFDPTRRGYYLNLANGEKAYVGDTVLVRFDNGNFKGIVKQTAGQKDGKITVIFPGRDKGRAVDPERIINVVSRGNSSFN